MNFYVDDSGTRTPDRGPTPFDPGVPNHFALGGVLVLERDEAVVRRSYENLRDRWGINYPLHSVEIRHGSGNFTWCKRSAPDYEPFMRDLTRMLTSIPVLGLACVIDRPGYDARYRPRYGRSPWRLCRTAFSIVIDRAAKHARRQDCRLRVLAEESTKKDDRKLKEYYDYLRTQGLPFDGASSAAYAPLCAAEFNELLYEFRIKKKSSPLIQIADVFLWPQIEEKYHPGYRPYQEFHDAGRLAECGLTAAECVRLGTKYSCFEMVEQARR